jgi:hypothetical protein
MFFLFYFVILKNQNSCNYHLFIIILVNILAEFRAQLNPIPGDLTQSPTKYKLSTGVLISGFSL